MTVVAGYQSLPLAVREQAELVLTRKQLDVLKLSLTTDGQGRYYGSTRIARMLGIAEPVAREHLRRAHDHLEPILEAYRKQAAA